MQRPVRSRREAGVLRILACLFVLLPWSAACRTASPPASAPGRAANTAAAPAAAPDSSPSPAPTSSARDAAARPVTSKDGTQPTVILLSFDGWRWDYETKAPTPNLRRVMARGVRAERLIPAFPSKTFPNHYTLVTGLYPAHHGIIGNSMHDPAMQADFSLSNRAAVGDGRWWGGEPLWVTAQRQGLLSATMYWPGSEAEIQGVRPRYWSLYDDKTAPPNEERVARLLAWLDLPAAERPSFITGYFSDTDHAGHDRGPDSAEVRDAIIRLDAVLGRLLDGLEARGLLDRVNLVITSDHGMAATSPDRVIFLGDYLDLQTVTLVDTNPTIGVIPKTVSADEVYRRLAKAHPHLQVYRREETPEAWHFRDHPRIPAIVGVADDGWVVRRERPKPGDTPMKSGGAHGYAPDADSMHGLFVAAGPAFRGGGVTVPAFDNIHVYNMLAAALGLRPAPNDGDVAVARRVLAVPIEETTTPLPGRDEARGGSVGSVHIGRGGASSVANVASVASVASVAASGAAMTGVSLARASTSGASSSTARVSDTPNRTLTAVRGVKVGHHTLSERPTGCTVVLLERGAVAGVDVRGSAPGTRETSLLSPVNTVEQVHAIVLAGGSAFGLDAASGVMRYLDERDIGFKLGPINVPIVPAAVLIDLWVGGKPQVRPSADCGYQAARDASSDPVAEGSVGAGAGATIGKLAGVTRAMKGGVGTASLTTADGVTLSALVAVNALGDVIDPATGRVVAGVRTADGKALADARVLLRTEGRAFAPPRAADNTTLGVIATNATLSKVQATRVAQVAHDGYARAIWPVHTQADGDTIFVVATGELPGEPDVTTIGALAADVMATAIVRAARQATSLPGIPAIADWDTRERRGR